MQHTATWIKSRLKVGLLYIFLRVDAPGEGVIICPLSGFCPRLDPFGFTPSGRAEKSPYECQVNCRLGLLKCKLAYTSRRSATACLGLFIYNFIHQKV